MLSIQSLPKGQFWRHNQVGDLVGSKNKLDLSAAKDLAKANDGKKGFTYTHYPVLGNTATAKNNRETVKHLCDNGMVINLSGNNLDHADDLYELGLAPVTTVLPSAFEGKSTRTPNGVKVVVCPAVLKDEMTCDKCKLCATPLSKRKYIIGFPAHGTQKKRIDEQLK